MKTTLSIVLLIATGVSLSAREPKEHDANVNYDESRLPHYDLPPLLVSGTGNPITTPEQWKNQRRPEILGLFSNLIYGCTPQPPSPIKQEFEVTDTDKHFMDGKATA